MQQRPRACLWDVGLPPPPAAAAWPHLCASAAAVHQHRTLTDESCLTVEFAIAREPGVLPEAASCSRQQFSRCPCQPCAATQQCRLKPQGGCRGSAWRAARTSLTCASPSDMCHGRRCSHHDELVSGAGTCLWPAQKGMRSRECRASGCDGLFQRKCVACMLRSHHPE